MRMRKKKNLIPRMEAHADRLIENPWDMPGHWRELLDFAPPSGNVPASGGTVPASGDAGDGLSVPRRDVLLEVGCGKGRFTAGLAEQYPEAVVIGLEIVPEAVVVAMERCGDQPNAFFIRSGAEQLPSFFAPGEVDALYLNFSDPWPSNRHAKRRLTHGNFLRLYRKILKPGGQMQFKTDNAPLFDFSLEELPRYGFALSEVTRDLHKDGPVGIMTDYEAKFHAQGLPIYRLVGTMEADWREPYPADPRAARKRWLAAFAGEVPADVLREHVTAEGNYLWHIFTWGKVPCLRGDAAREALSQKAAEGGEAYLFYWEYPPAGRPAVVRVGVPVPENLPGGENFPGAGSQSVGESSPGAGNPSGGEDASGFDGADWYLTDREFTWTYVHTHEQDSDDTLGPFFCQAKE